MAVNLHRIDQIKDYDSAIAALEEYVEELVTEFAESPEGKSYLDTHPEMTEYIGSWIDNLLYFGYAYESVTLPRMNVDSIKVIVTKIFPSKISLLNPEEANTTIPELLAFWQFLKREYQHSQAHKILKYLKQIQPKFKKIMNDPANFGMAKSFFMQGVAEGFDMTTEAGLQQFQQQHNQQLPKSNGGGSLPNLGGLSLVQADGSLIDSSQAELHNLLNELAAEVLSQVPRLFKPGLACDRLPRSNEQEEIPSVEEFHRQLEAEMAEKLLAQLPPLPTDIINLLKQKQVSESNPGTILVDFQALIDFIGDGLIVSGKRNLIPMKSLAEFNQKLAEPIQTNLQRPQQKSYPSINGLYLLLRASGLGQISSKRKKMILTLNPEILAQWQQMNSTERYFNLLEVWLIVANEEMLGERGGHMSEGTKCWQYWSLIPQGEKFQTYEIQQNIRYYPGFHNLALMKLFGLAEANYGKPEAGKGWRVKSIKKTPWGEAVMQTALRGILGRGRMWDEEKPTQIKFGQLQPVMQEYFPEWQQVIVMPGYESCTGVYTFKVTLGKAWRRIAISSQMTLWDLSQLILQSVDFDSDHLDMFSYKNPLGRTANVYHPYMDDFPATDEVTIQDLPLKVGSLMEYVFDFGDHWEFQLQLEEINTSDLRPDYGEIISSKGKAPEQYPDWEE